MQLTEKCILPYVESENAYQTFPQRIEHETCHSSINLTRTKCKSRATRNF